jgi:PAS domain S-box-containing protein
MKVVNSLAMRVAPWAIPLLTIGIFVFDLLTPVGVAVSALYIIPLLLTFFSPRKYDLIYFSVAATALVWIDLWLKPQGIPIPYGAFNRMLATLVMWGAALGLIHYRRVQEGLIGSEAARAQAVTRAEAAIEARALSDAAVLGASASRREVEMQAETQFRLAVEASPNGMLMVDGNGAILMVNRQIEQQFGYERAELIGQPVEMLVPQRVRSHHAGDRAEFLAHSESRSMGKGRDLYGVRKDGQEFPLEIGLNPLQTPDGMRVLASVVDISERKHIQEQLRKAERLAELGTLASGMAHEIGTPMNVILGRAEYLMDRVKDEPVKKGLQTIVAQVERITRVMNQLLAFARRKPPERRSLALKDIVENSVEMFQERLAKSQVRIETQLGQPCPNVLADADQMSQVVINLVMNAIHAMPEGGTLRIGLSPDKEMVKLTVADAGHGIPQEAIEKIFEPFFTTKEFGKGTGLGLTVVKGIVDEHRGTIAVESEPGKGTTFTIHLPISPANG